jgi:hypothetical protein
MGDAGKKFNVAVNVNFNTRNLRISSLHMGLGQVNLANKECVQ